MNIKSCISTINNCTMLSCEYHTKNKCDYSYEVREKRFECAKRQAIKALEKQIPKNILYKKQCHKTQWQCPICEADQVKVEFLCVDGTEPEEKYSFCWKCGQKIDWHLK